MRKHFKEGGRLIMKIFIVGASGRVGTKLASILAKMGHQVYAVQGILKKILDMKILFQLILIYIQAKRN